ncbi:MAG TPA: adenosylcobinamide-GDP ribazoletransferase [Bacillota bacterium]|nr:adenosylcobinamide-GDP ribazoletransferase [Bacillota bacterium]
MAVISRFVTAVQSLTRLHIMNVEWNEEDYGRSSAYFTLVGMLIGTILWAVWATAGKHFPTEVVSALLIVAHLLITGGMHLDGFMDSMDGLFSGRSRERKLEIMKDSRVGANGVMAVVVLLLYKYTLLLHLPQNALAVLVLMPAFGRWANVYVFRRFPYARPDGLGKAMVKYTALTDVLFALLVLTAASFWLLGIPGLVMLGVLTLLVHLMASRITATIGGTTGDIFGFLIEISEVIFLTMIYIV